MDGNPSSTAFDRKFAHLPFSQIPGGRITRLEDSWNSVTTTVIRWQMGVASHRRDMGDNIREPFATRMNRQLIQSRAVQRRQKEQKEPESCGDWKDLCTNQHSSGGTSRGPGCTSITGAWNSGSPSASRWLKAKVKPSDYVPSFSGNFLVLKKSNSNLRLFYEMCPYFLERPLKVKFSIRDLTTEKWKKLCIWSVSSFSPNMENGRLRRASNALMVLRGSKVFCYELSTGKLISWVDLTFDDSPEIYNDISVDYETGHVLVMATASAVKKATQGCGTPMIQELVILNFPPLVILYRLLFPVDVWPRLHSFNLQNNVGIAKCSNAVEIFDVRLLIHSNMSDQDRGSCCTDIFSVPGGMRTMTISQKVGHLTTFPSKDRYIQFTTALQPPCVVLKNKKLEYELYSLENLRLPLKTVSAAALPTLPPDEQYELLMSNKQDTLRFHLESDSKDSNSKYFVVQDFCPTTLDKLRSLSSDSVLKMLKPTSPVNNNEANRSSREGLRRKATKIDYIEDYVACTAVNGEAGLLAVCTLTDATLNAMIYNNDNLELIARLDPVTIPLGKLSCHQLVASLTDSCLAILVYLHPGVYAQVQTVLCLSTSLLGETISE